MYQVNNGDCTAGSVTLTVTGDYNSTADTVWMGGEIINTAGAYDWQHYQQAQQWVPEYDYTKYGYEYKPDNELNEKLAKLFEKVNLDQLGELVSNNPKKKTKKKKGEFYTMKRLIQIVVVDPDKRVNDADSVVHMGEPIVTSLADEDLLLEVDLKGALATHNEVRKGIEDEDRSDKRNKIVYLKGVKISELVVKVVTIAKF